MAIKTKKPIIATLDDGTPITIGMECTTGFNGDRYPYEVIAIDSATQIVVRAMDHKPDPNSKDAPGICFAENPNNFIYSSNPQGIMRIVKKHKKLGRDKKTWHTYWGDSQAWSFFFGRAMFSRNPSF